MSIRISNKATGDSIGEISEQDLDILIGFMEEESSTDQDYYIDNSSIDALEFLGTSPGFVALLKTAVGESEGVDIVWVRGE